MPLIVTWNLLIWYFLKSILTHVYFNLFCNSFFGYLIIHRFYCFVSVPIVCFRNVLFSGDLLVEFSFVTLIFFLFCFAIILDPFPESSEHLFHSHYFSVYFFCCSCLFSVFAFHRVLQYVINKRVVARDNGREE